MESMAEKEKGKRKKEKQAEGTYYPIESLYIGIYLRQRRGAREKVAYNYSHRKVTMGEGTLWTFQHGPPIIPSNFLLGP